LNPSPEGYQALARKDLSAATAEAGKPPAEAPFDVGKFAAIGLAIGAIGTALGAVLTGFLSLSWWQMPLAVDGLVPFLSGSSMIIAYFKLRKRNLAPILDANGWAVNTRAIVNIPFGKTLTALARLPEGAQSSLWVLLQRSRGHGSFISSWWRL
jgi:hypothetical protein